MTHHVDTVGAGGAGSHRRLRHRMRESKQTVIACGVFLALLAGGLAAAAKWWPYDPVKAKAFVEKADARGKHHDKHR